MVVWSAELVQDGRIQDLEDAYGIVPLPKGPRADEHVWPVHNDGVLVLPITVTQARAKIELYNALFKLTAPYMDDDVDIDTYIPRDFQNALMATHDRESYENLKTGLYNRDVERIGFVLADIFRPAAMRVITEGGSPAGLMAEIEPQAQQLLDELFGR